MPTSNNSPHLLLISATTGYQTRMFVEAAAGLDFQLTLATDRCHVLENPWGDDALPIRFDDPAGSSGVLAEHGPFDGMVALGDRPACFAAAVADRLSIPYNSVESVEACRDKFVARRQFQRAGLPVPRFERLPMAEGPGTAAARIGYPCVLKPLHLSASRGVIRANHADEFIAAFERIRTMVPADEFIQVEAFIPGREFALEGLLVDGRLTVLALFDKPDPLDGPYFEETLYVTPSREGPEVRQAIADTAARAVRALGLTRGPVHAELRVNPAGVWMLEVAARPIGGLCARVLPGLAELILRHAAGEDVRGLEWLRDAAGVMMIPIPRAGIYQGVRGVEAARSVAGIEDIVITSKQGQLLVPLPEGNSYLGFIFARADEPAAAEAALRSAHAALHFETTASLTLVNS